MRSLQKTISRVEKFIKEYRESDDTTQSLLIGRPLNIIIQSLKEKAHEDESIENQIDFLNTIAGLMTQLTPFLSTTSESVLIKITEIELNALCELINKVTSSHSDLATVVHQHQQCLAIFRQIASIKDTTPSHEVTRELLIKTQNVIQAQIELQQIIVINFAKITSAINSEQVFNGGEMKSLLTSLQSRINGYWLAAENEQINLALLGISKTEQYIKEQMFTQIQGIQAHPWASIQQQEGYYTQLAESIRFLLADRSIELTAEEKHQCAECLRIGVLTQQSDYVQLLREFIAIYYANEPHKIEEITTYLESCPQLRKRVQFKDTEKTAGTASAIKRRSQPHSESGTSTGSRASIRSRLDADDASGQMSTIENYLINIMAPAQLEGKNISRIYAVSLLKSLSEAIFKLKIEFSPKICICYDLLVKVSTPAQQVNPELSQTISGLIEHFNKEFGTVLIGYQKFSQKENPFSGSIPYSAFKDELNSIVLQLKVLLGAVNTNSVFTQLIKDWIDLVAKENIISKAILDAIKLEFSALTGVPFTHSQAPRPESRDVPNTTAVSTTDSSSSSPGISSPARPNGSRNRVGKLANHPLQGGLRLFSTPPAAAAALPVDPSMNMDTGAPEING